MEDNVQTWHYGLVARHWAEHNTSGPEIPTTSDRYKHTGNRRWMPEELDPLQKYFFAADFRKNSCKSVKSVA